MKRIATAVAALLLTVSCTGQQGKIDQRRVRAAAFSLVRFDSCADLLAHLKTEALKLVGPYGLAGGVRALAAMEDTAERAMAAPQAAGAAQAGTDYSATNVQEKDVDEPDMMKTDGKRMFVTSGGALRAIDVTSPSPRLLGKLAIDGTDMLLAGNRLVVFGGTGNVMPMDAPAMSSRMIYPGGGYESTQIRVIDVADPAAMKVVSTATLQGSYVSARLAGGIVRTVIRTSAQPRIAFRNAVSEQDVASATADNKSAIEHSTIDRWLPTYTLDGKQGNLADCDTTYRPATFSGLGFTSVLTIDPADPSPKPSATVTSDSQNVYSSAERLYVTTVKYAEQPVAKGNPEVTTTEAPKYVPPTTAVHAFDITDKSKAAYLGSGGVDGTVLNQFSLSEHKGVLRIATTVDAMNGASDSRVSVLQLKDGTLNVIGSVAGLGKGERIYAVRFIEDLGYVVTFRQIDPLYVIDLRDPAQPKVTGELKIPGFSAYLHPIGDGHLLGVGQDATEQGRTTGTQVSIFDVRDPAAPKRVQNLLVGGHSEAESDHHAFLYWAKSKLAVIPTQSWGTDNFSGAVALHVDPAAALTERGRIGHPAVQPRYEPGVVKPTEPGAVEPSRPGVAAPDIAPVPYSPAIRRSAVIGNALFTISDTGVMSSELSSLKQVGWLQFAA